MSTAANLPPRSKRLSLRLTEFGLPIPQRVAQFLDGPEVEALEGARAWGMAGFSGDTKMKVKWASARLYHIHDYATDGHFGTDAADKYLPIAAIGSESRMFAVDVSKPELPVVFFDYEEGYAPWAESFEAFLGKLLKRGDKTPSEKLDKAYELAKEHYEAKRYTEVLEILLPMAAKFPTTLSDDDDARDTLGSCYNLIGIAHEKAKRIIEATAAYELALAMGTESAGLNICDLLLDEHKDYPRLVEFGEKQQKNIWAFGDKYAWFHIRNYLGQGYLLTGKPTQAIRMYHQIFEMFSTSDPAKVSEAVDDLRKVRDRPEADATTISTILGWLDVPPPAVPAARLAALRAWWPTVPGVARVAIKSAINFEGETPGDEELIRITNLTDLEVEDEELKDLAWVTMLDKLDDLDFEGSSVTDLTPVASLRRLTRLDCSQNKITTLAPLAKLRWLERLSAGENELETDLSGLENLHELSYLHVTEAGLETIEPLRGLRELEEVTLYDNKITDLSPLADSPRIKEISSFSNPITTGLAALGRLRWLESIDAGEEPNPADVQALHAANPRVEIDNFYPDDDEDKVDVVLPPDPTLRAWWDGLPKAWQDAFDSELERESRGKQPTDEALLKLVYEDSISIDDKPLPDLEPMRKFSRADFINFGNTGIVDLSPLSRLASMRELIVRDNKVDLATLAPAEQLEELYIERCQLTSLAGIAGCKLLREIHGEENLVEDLTPLAGLKDLRILDLEANRVSDLTPLANLPRLRTLKLGLNRVSDLGPLSRCLELRVVELWANLPLRNGLALADLPDLVRVVSHGSLSREDLAELRRRRPDVSWD